MNTEKIKRFLFNRRSFLVVISLIICIGLLGVSFARYIAENNHKEDIKLADFNIQVYDMETMKAPDWHINIPATTRLYDDVNFNSTVVVKRLMITNMGNQTVDIGAKLKDAVTSDNHNHTDTYISAEDIFIYAFNYDVQSDFQAAIQATLDETLNAESLVADLKSGVSSVTSQNLRAWSYELKPGESRFLTVLVWRENDAMNNETSFEKTVYLKEHLELDVLQKEEVLR